MLIYEYEIAIRIGEHKAGGAGGAFIGFGIDGYAVAFKLLLYVAHIVEGIDVLSVVVPAGVEGEDIALEHTLEQAYEGIAVFHDEVIVLHASAKYVKAQVLIKLPGYVKVFYTEADGKCS